MSQESAGFEKRIRGIKGSDTATSAEGPSVQRLKSSDMCLKALYGHHGGVLAVDFDFPFGTLVTGSVDKTLRVWDLTSRSCTHILAGHTGARASAERCLALIRATARRRLGALRCDPSDE